MICCLAGSSISSLCMRDCRCWHHCTCKHTSVQVIHIMQQVSMLRQMHWHAVKQAPTCKASDCPAEAGRLIAPLHLVQQAGSITCNKGETAVASATSLDPQAIMASSRFSMAVLHESTPLQSALSICCTSLTRCKTYCPCYPRNSCNTPEAADGDLNAL